ncbi:MAG TPA: 4Fe-4S binding protein [Dissulfurispiraceae bacterium]|nr:4Fe-4S binding protein [Dissulfurispiraceae bacterium]
MKTVRKIIEINEELCNGCGECVPNCAEGALKIVDGKAKMVSEIYCDGLGACLGHCPQGALKIVEREAEEFDEHAVEELLKTHGGKEAPASVHSGCPGSRLHTFGSPCQEANRPVSHGEGASALTHWPVQIRLVPPTAPFLKGAHLLVAADCTAYSYADFHGELLAGKALMIGCPKFDDPQEYLSKFVEIFRNAGIRKITVVDMEVPCCSKLPMIVKKAMELSGKSIPMEEIVIGIRGEVLKRIQHAA